MTMQGIGPAKIKLLLGLAALVTVAGGSALWLARFYHPSESNGPNSEDRFAQALFVAKPVTLAPGVHLLGALAPGAAYVIETTEGLVLVDAGFEEDASGVARQIADLGLKMSDLKAVLLTGVHADHVLGAQRLREVTGAKIYAGQGDTAVLKAGAPREAIFSTFELEGDATHATEVDVELRGGEFIEVGDTRIEVLATPGHSPGSVCYLLERKGLRLLFTGDTISSLVGELGTYTAYLPPRYRGDARDYLQTLKSLRARLAPDVVLPGHPHNTRIVHRPRPPANQWYEVLDRGVRELERLVARFEADGEDFLDGNPKEILPQLRYLGDHGGRAIYAVLDDDQQYIFDAPGDDDLGDFVVSRLQEAGVAQPNIAAVILTSADSAATTGLSALVKRTSCAVVASIFVHDELRRMCPDQTRLIRPEEIKRLGRYVVESIPLGGRGIVPTGWWLRDGDRTVLISGQVPAPIGQASMNRLRDEAQADLIDVPPYLDTIESLRGRRPHVWLVAYPANGQNANLYDDQWRAILNANQRAAKGGS